MRIGAHSTQLYRFGPDLKELPFSNPGTPSWFKGNPEGRIIGFAKNRGRGLTADAFGNVYALWKKAERAQPGDAHRAHGLYVYAPDGSLKKSELIDASIPSVSSVRVDYGGNIYVAVGLRPGKDWLPPGLKGKLPEGREDPDAVNQVNGYPLIYGSIIKFSPRGGVIREGIGGIPCNHAHGFPIEVKGAEWIFPGASPVISWSTPKRAEGTILICLCDSPRFDVDGFGRSFFPDAGRCRVGVIDSAGNLISWFGGYGNPDSAGPDSAIPTPDVPLCWPQAVAVGDDFVYVGDRMNRRILKVKLAYRAEASCLIE
jgi:hypothetical protein